MAGGCDGKEQEMMQAFVSNGRLTLKSESDTFVSVDSQPSLTCPDEFDKTKFAWQGGVVELDVACYTCPPTKAPTSQCCEHAASK